MSKPESACEERAYLVNNLATADACSNNNMPTAAIRVRANHLLPLTLPIRLNILPRDILPIIPQIPTFPILPMHQILRRIVLTTRAIREMAYNIDRRCCLLLDTASTEPIAVIVGDCAYWTGIFVEGVEGTAFDWVTDCDFGDVVVGEGIAAGAHAVSIGILESALPHWINVNLGSSLSTPPHQGSFAPGTSDSPINMLRPAHSTTTPPKHPKPIKILTNHLPTLKTHPVLPQSRELALTERILFLANPLCALLKRLSLLAAPGLGLCVRGVFDGDGFAGAADEGGDVMFVFGAGGVGAVAVGLGVAWWKGLVWW